MEISMACCGYVCDGCEQLNKNCGGCASACGSPCDFGSCPIYKCCITENEFPDCSVCPEFPCETFMNHKRPDMTDEENRIATESRIILLDSIHHGADMSGPQFLNLKEF